MRILLYTACSNTAAKSGVECFPVQLESYGGQFDDLDLFSRKDERTKNIKIAELSTLTKGLLTMNCLLKRKQRIYIKKIYHKKFTTNNLKLTVRHQRKLTIMIINE